MMQTIKAAEVQQGDVIWFHQEIPNHPKILTRFTVTHRETVPNGNIRLSGTNTNGYADIAFLNPATPVRKTVS